MCVVGATASLSRTTSRRPNSCVRSRSRMSRTLAALAIIKENWNADRDYLSNFEPFVFDALRRLPPGVPVETPSVVRAVGSDFGVQMPQGVVETLLKRATRRGMLAKGAGQRERFIVPEALDKTLDLMQARGDASRDVHALLDALRAHAEQAGVTWTEEQAEAALLGFLDESGTQFAAGRRHGRSVEQGIKRDQAVALVHSFARHAVERDSEGLRLLEQAVKGSMLSNVLYFENLGSFSPSLDDIAVYIDTPIVLRLLGVSTPQQVDASRELLKMLKGAMIPVSIFTHTVTEVESVLESTAGNLRRSRSKAASSTMHLSSTSREVIEYFIESSKTPADVEEVLAELEHRLRMLGVRIVERPDPVAALTVDEEKLDEALQTAVGYRSKHAKHRDLQSIAAIHLLRKGRFVRQLGDCKALFVTTNGALVRASHRFFREEGLNGGASHLMSESEFVTQLWIRSPDKSPDLPRKTLIADAYAALNPPGRLWDKYVEEIENLQAAGAVDEDQVARLVFSTSARGALLDISLGDADRVEADTVSAVLERADAALLDPVVQEHETKIRVLADRQANELDALRRTYADAQATQQAQHATEVERLQEVLAQRQSDAREHESRLEALEAKADAETKERADRRKKRLKVTGSGSLLLLSAVSATLVLTSIATGNVLRAALVGVTVYLAASAGVVAVGPDRRDTVYKALQLFAALAAIVVAYAIYASR